MFLLATILAVGLFFYLGNRTAEALTRQDLFDQAENLAISLDDNRPFMPFDQLVEAGIIESSTVFVIRDRDEDTIASSGEAFEIATREFTSMRGQFQYFTLDSFGAQSQTYTGLITREGSERGRVTVIVAEPYNPENAILSAMLDEFAATAAWIVPIFVLTTLMVSVAAIRGGLKPLLETASQAKSIRPESLSIRLDTTALPTEIAPMVTAVNQALGRLEEGFEIQRRFTANAAHELRTPLTIISGAIENLDTKSDTSALRLDIERMNRLVNQLLQVARLDSGVLDRSEKVDLQACARDVVEYIAPLAIYRNRKVALTGVTRPLVIQGNRHATEDALRNLVENALNHTPENTEVQVNVSEDFTIEVTDEGPGIDDELGKQIFDRFCRAPSNTTPGAGLGLAIVSEIMKLHEGTVEYFNRPSGGACFRLHFKRKLENQLFNASCPDNLAKNT
ncbi:MAG: ATP-binding protein [Gammaproteobacteria bacterium]